MAGQRATLQIVYLRNTTDAAIPIAIRTFANSVWLEGVKLVKVAVMLQLVEDIGSRRRTALKPLRLADAITVEPRPSPRAFSA